MARWARYCGARLSGAGSRQKEQSSKAVRGGALKLGGTLAKLQHELHRRNVHASWDAASLAVPK
jgi:hypothetical protein